MATNTNALASDARANETPLARIVREQGRLKGWLADRIGCGPERLSRLLTGERSLTLEEASKASRALGVPIETFLEGEAE